MPMEHMNTVADVWDDINAERAARVQTRPANRAAWQKEKGGSLIVGEAPYPAPNRGQIVVKLSAIAMNPADWAVRDMGILVLGQPNICGCEAAGTVVEVGQLVNDVQIGDRVFGACRWSEQLELEEANKHGAFQEYALMTWPLYGKTPDNITDAEAATISMGMATAADGLFQPWKLGLDLPKEPPAAPKNETVMLWAGSTSVGAWGIQMLVAAGYDVVTTSSPRNFDFCKEIGASAVFDYNSSTIEADMIKALQGRKVVGTIGAMSTPENIPVMCRILAALPDARKHLISVFPGTDKFLVEGITEQWAEMSACGWSALGPYLWGEWAPKALANDSAKIRPEPRIVGHGLEAIEGALNTLKAGVSAAKIVVTL